nr:uncharacterized protein LOC115847667 [Globicephala melas]
MTTDSGSKRRETVAGERGWERRHPPTPWGQAPPRKPFSDCRCARRRGLLALRPGPAPAGEPRVGLPRRPAERAPFPLAPGSDSPAAGGDGGESSAARGAGSHLPRARGGGSGRRGGGCRDGARHLGRVTGSSGAAAGRGAAEGCGPVGGPGAASRAYRSARPSLLLLLFLWPGLRRSLPAGPVSGLSAEDPPPGAALRLLRRRRMRRRLLLPASRQPWRPRGTHRPSPAGEARREGGEQTRGSIPRSPHPGSRLRAPPPRPQAKDAGLAPGGGGGE